MSQAKRIQRQINLVVLLENEIIRRELLERRKRYMETKMQQLNLAMASLNEEEYKVIHHFYIDGKRYYEFIVILLELPRGLVRGLKRGEWRRLLWGCLVFEI